LRIRFTELIRTLRILRNKANNNLNAFTISIHHTWNTRFYKILLTKAQDLKEDDNSCDDKSKQHKLSRRDSDYMKEYGWPEREKCIIEKVK